MTPGPRKKLLYYFRGNPDHVTLGLRWTRGYSLPTT